MKDEGRRDFPQGQGLKPVRNPPRQPGHFNALRLSRMRMVVSTKGAANNVSSTSHGYMFCRWERVTFEPAFTSPRSQGSVSDDLDLRGRLDFVDNGAEIVTAARGGPPAIVKNVFRLLFCADTRIWISTEKLKPIRDRWTTYVAHR
ncbi:GM15187 [Drosophila sechellia]|uniref:GM15187 n=1 Tax=Drosophila sechellia TaxID=7238 RepID=B4IBQ0_DROSE|nr:GM15187 [Drosophila sechellia]